MKHKMIWKRISVLSLIGCLLLAMLPVSFQADPIDAGPKASKVDESSIPEDAISISTTYDLMDLAENCIDEEYSKGKVFVLKQDIHMTGVDFSGIPTFGGTFLGQGHKIYGIEFEQDENALGFFRYLQKDAVVNGLILQMNIQPGGSNSMIGGIAGVNKGTIRNCIVNGVVSGKSMVGGFVGVNKVSGIIENCTMNGLVHGASKVGGFVGKNQGVIRECINNAEVNTAVEHNTIGMDISNMDMDMELSLDMDMDSFGFSESMDSACDIGGMAGTSSGVIRSCVNKGNVGYEKMSTNVGGIVGSSNGYIAECVNYAEINGAKGVGGIAGQLKPSLVIRFDEMVSGGAAQNMNSIEIEISDENRQSIKDMMNELEKLENQENKEDVKLPEDMEDIELPEDMEDIELPEDMEDIELPEDMEDIELPEDFEDIELPEDFEDIELPEDMEDIELPEDFEDIELPEEFEDIELPEYMEDLEDLESEEFDEDKFNAALNDLSNSLDDSLEESDIPLDIETGENSDMTISLEGLDMDMSVGIEVVDVSRDDTEADTIAKTYQCVNYGNVYASKYAGGIAGNANSSSTMDMDDNVDMEGEMSMSGKGEQRLVIRDCTNYGTIAINNKYAGGIVGYMAMGAIFDGKNLGNLDCLSADYVGGIAGGCNAAIFNSISKCVLAGSDYVGGIAGWGYECYDSCAVVDIAAGTKYVGSIFGSTEVLPDDRAEDTEAEEEKGPLVTGNTYYIVGKNIGGIDGINYAGVSKQISLEEFLAKENLADIFKNVSVRFAVEGQDDVVLTTQTGGTIALDQLPVPEVKEGEIYEWVFKKPVTSKVLGMNEVEEVLYLSEARLTNILFNQTYEADFEPKHMVAKGKDTTSDGKTRVLAIGAFDTDTDIILENMLSKESEVLGVRVSENWAVTISNIGVEELRYYIPGEMDAEKLSVYVKDADGNWSEREATVIGSYIAFAFADGDQGFAFHEASNSRMGMMLIVAGVVLIIAGIIIIRNKKAKVVKNEK